MIAQYYGFIPSSSDDDESSAEVPSKFQIMPALGTHAPMTQTELESMYGADLANKRVIDCSGNSESPFLVHNWRTDVTTIGHVDAKLVEIATRGMVKDQPWPAQLNNLVWSKRQPTDTQNNEITNKNVRRSSDKLVVSVGQVRLLFYLKKNSDKYRGCLIILREQNHHCIFSFVKKVVPHEVMGMANFNKNLFVGVGGLEAINLSHFIGAVYGMENMMGKWP